MRSPTFALVALALLAPGAAAMAGPGETAHVVFYGHVFGLGLQAPMPSNAQPPEGEEVFGLGATDVCAAVPATPEVPNVGRVQDCESNPDNKLALFSSAGFVDVKGRDEFNSKGDYTLFHNERGLTKDILLDPEQNVKATLWMSLDSHVWFVGGGNNETDCPVNNPRDVACPYPSWGWDPAIWHDWQVEATLYAANLGAHGSAPSEAPPIQAALADGSARVIAQGATAPRQVINGLPGNPNVHVFEVDLGKPLDATIKKEESFFLVYSFHTNTGGNEYSIHNWRLWAGEFFPPTYTLPVKNAFDVELVVPTFLHEKLVVIGVMNTPWGSYDVDPARTKLTITTKDGGREIEPFRIQSFSDYSVAHGGHYLPVNETWIWDYKRDGLAPGTYVATVTAQNWQGTAFGRCSGEFTVGPGGDPGPILMGQCGERTADDAFVQERTEGAAPASERERVALPLGGLGAVGLGLVLQRRRSA